RGGELLHQPHRDDVLRARGGLAHDAVEEVGGHLEVVQRPLTYHTAVLHRAAEHLVMEAADFGTLRLQLGDVARRFRRHRRGEGALGSADVTAVLIGNARPARPAAALAALSLEARHPLAEALYAVHTRADKNRGNRALGSRKAASAGGPSNRAH